MQTSLLLPYLWGSVFTSCISGKTKAVIYTSYKNKQHPHLFFPMTPTKVEMPSLLSEVIFHSLILNFTHYGFRRKPMLFSQPISSVPPRLLQPIFSSTQRAAPATAFCLYFLSRLNTIFVSLWNYTSVFYYIYTKLWLLYIKTHSPYRSVKCQISQICIPEIITMKSCIHVCNI